MTWINGAVIAAYVAGAAIGMRIGRNWSPRTTRIVTVSYLAFSAAVFGAFALNL